MFRWVMVVGLLGSLSGCAGTAAPKCAPGVGAPVAVFTLFFGNSIPGRGDLTDREWQGFLDSTVTVNLPNGYTVFDASGAWMNPATHKTLKEATRVLLAALPETPDSMAAIDRIRTAYRMKFQQQLVGMTVAPACGIL